MPDDMFFSADNLSLRRGRRVAKRTPTFRPCTIWPLNEPQVELQGVVLNISPYGMLVRLKNPMPVGTVIRVQLMRDDTQKALSVPVQGHIVRHDHSQNPHLQFGVRLTRDEITRAPDQLLRPSARPTNALRNRSRMHTLDITVGDSGIRRIKR